MADFGTPSIQNVIVVMLENRSYDNVLGWLYNSSNKPPYQSAPSGQQGLNGLTGSESNPTSSGGRLTVANQTTPTQVDGSGFSYSAKAIPVVDPGEVFDDMAQQITGSSSRPDSNPYTIWPSGSDTLMQGFVYNYEGKADSPNLQDVMNYFTPEQLPVTAWLANNFSVCDTWYASLPTQTFSNRVFGHCAAPGVAKKPFERIYFSMVDDVQYITDKFEFEQLPSVFQALDATPPVAAGSGANWKLYFHDYSISIMTVPYVAKVAASSSNVNVSTFDSSDWGTAMPHQLEKRPPTFVEDLENGTLPPYSFIEPRYSNTYTWLYGGIVPSAAPNSNHPGGSHALFPAVGKDTPPIDASSGELFLMRLYNMLRNSNYWAQSLLIITYDELGGVYDHQPPPASTPPGTINWIDNSNPPFSSLPSARDDLDKASDGFDFNAFGGRVPAIVVSPFVKAGSTLVSSNTQPFDHSSIVRTVLNVFGQTGTSLNARDAAAPSVTESPNVSTANNNPAPGFSGVLVPAPSSLAFHVRGGETKQQTLQAGSGGTGLAASVSSSGTSWLSVSSKSTTSNGFESIDVTVSVDASRLSDGEYSGSIAVRDSGGNTVTVPVAMKRSLI